MSLKVLDLFSGIGGFSLGLERAGMKTVQFCEIDPFCRAVLKKHWPEVPCHDDIRTFDGGEFRGAIDVICGGFPCQDISIAGKGAGLAGERSGLWYEYARVIGEVRPRFVIVENVAALLGRGLGTVLGDLASFGFDAEWHCIPASAVGAPHRRDRIWIIAHAQSMFRNGGNDYARRDREGERSIPKSRDGRGDDDMDHYQSKGLEGRTKSTSVRPPQRFITDVGEQDGWWGTEPDVGRVAHGVPSRVDRLRSLGNAVVPQIPEMIGRAIMKKVNALL